MLKFWLRFWGALASLAGVAGLWFAADAVHLQGVFWILVVCAAVIAMMGIIWPKVSKLLLIVRNHPIVQAQLGELEAELSACRAEMVAADARALAARDEGIEEGRAQAVGSVLATISGPTQINSIAVYEGNLAMVLSLSEPFAEVGARFQVSFTVTGQIKGVIEIISVERDRDLAFAICVEATSTGFWSALTERVEHDPRPPAGVELRALRLPVRETSNRRDPFRTADEPQPEESR